MNMNAYIDEIKLKLTGQVLHLEIDDTTLTRIVNSAFREIQRYIDTTKLVTLPYKPCIDLSTYKVNSVSSVYRAQGYLTDASTGDIPGDPVYVAQWQFLSGNGQAFNTNDWVLNYAAWNTAMQIRNTISTDLQYRFDRSSNLLYINAAFDSPDNVTIEYVPVYDNIEQVESDFWIDVIIRLSVALTKVTLGRIRSRFKQSNALWEQDGDSLLEEGNTELASLREELKVSTQLVYPID